MSSNVTSSTAPKMITHHSGSVILYNLASVKRLKRNGSTYSKTWKEEEDKPLLVRVKLENDGSAWICGHLAHREIFTSSIFAFATVNAHEPSAVHVAMKDWAQRRNALPITRKFVLFFYSAVEAECFAFSFNHFLGKREEAEEEEEEEKNSMYGKEKAEEEEEEEKKSTYGKEEAEEEEEEEKNSTYGILHVWEDEGKEEVQVKAAEEEEIICWDAEDTQDPFAEYISD